ncbi:MULTISPECIES: Crp/Fnr family transcriptional regulator [unclassified Saccharothrix]|uniref:Crp/Fnr family transcriptional regulator n=1 Tax=unclassified Saccharothrix TaxID=2593673 RepID=UPI00307DB19F
MRDAAAVPPRPVLPRQRDSTTAGEAPPSLLAAELAALGREVTADSGTTLVEQGAAQAPVFLVTGGVVKALRSAQPDSSPMLLSVHKRGDVLGVADAVRGRPAHLSYTVAKDATLKVVPRTTFVNLVRSNPAVALSMSVGLADDVDLRDRSLAYAPLAVENRLVAFLDQQSQSCSRTSEGWVLFDLGLTQNDLAAAIGASQPAVHKVLKKLDKEGKVSIGYRTLYVKQRLSMAVRDEDAGPVEDRQPETGDAAHSGDHG